VDLAFETNQHNVLQFISSNFNEDTEPLLLDKTAAFFLQNEQYEKVRNFGSGLKIFIFIFSIKIFGLECSHLSTILIDIRFAFYD
jgi:hypothetical protein